jgi:MinD superfamily P-loop ATPase
MSKNLPQVKTEICSSCGMCIEVCPCHSVGLDKGTPVFSCPDECTPTSCDDAGCGCVCEDACPEGAISCSFEVVLEPPAPKVDKKTPTCRCKE